MADTYVCVCMTPHLKTNHTNPQYQTNPTQLFRLSSAAGRGGLAVRLAGVEVGPFFHTLCDLVALIAQEHGLHFIRTLDPDLPRFLYLGACSGCGCWTPLVSFRVVLRRPPNHLTPHTPNTSIPHTPQQTASASPSSS